MFSSQMIQQCNIESKNSIFCDVNGLKKKLKLDKKEIEDNFREITRVSNKFKRLSENKLSFNSRSFDDVEHRYYEMYSVEFDSANEKLIISTIINEKRKKSTTEINYYDMVSMDFDELYEFIYDKCDDIHNFCIGRNKKIKSRADKECEEFMINNGYMKKYNPDNFDVIKGVRTAINNSLRK